MAQRLRLGDHATSVLETMRMHSRIASGDSGVELDALNGGSGNHSCSRLQQDSACVAQGAQLNQANRGSSHLLLVPGGVPVFTGETSSLLSDFEDLENNVMKIDDIEAGDIDAEQEHPSRVRFFIDDEDNDTTDERNYLDESHKINNIPVIVLPM